LPFRKIDTVAIEDIQITAGSTPGEQKYMKRSLIITVILAVATAGIGAQTLYMPRGVKRAFDTGTRSADGRPGPKYWQNKGIYNIAISVNPPDRVVRGTEDITYTNSSPSPLSRLVFRLELNSHQPEAPRESPIESDYLTPGIHIDEYSENGSVKPWTEIKGLTFMPVELAAPLAPRQSIKLSFKWHYDLSVKSNREGVIDPSSFFIAYFYPRVAVYDDTDGWDMAFFVEGHEFYNDFNDYTLQVTAPKNFVVWATGDLQNPDEVLRPEFAARLKASMTSNKTVHVATLQELNAKSVTQQSDMLTWKWRADNVSDMAAGMSDHFIWDAASVVVDKATGRRASVQAAYDEKSKDFQKMVEYGVHTLDWCSNNFPGVPYPFSKTTIFRGFADMEYPMMVNQSTQQEPAFARFIAEHEILHSWFPFYMGINEQRYGFMDEGWTTAFEYMIGTEDLGKERADAFFKQFRVSGWIGSASADADLPIMLPGDAMTGGGFGNSEYGKAALGYIAIKDLLGDAEFARVLHKFMTDWNGKHPLPWDMFNSFNATSGRNLNWFFKNWYFDNGYIDLGIDSVTADSGNVVVKIKNTGGYAAPVNVVVKYADGTAQTLHQTPAIWERDQRNAIVSFKDAKTIASITLDGGIYMDANSSDNIWPSPAGGQ
jgi:Peptidase family M1 domain